MRSVWPLAIAPLMFVAFLVFEQGDLSESGTASAALPSTTLEQALRSTRDSSDQPLNYTPAPIRIPQFLRGMLNTPPAQYAQAGDAEPASADPADRFPVDSRFAGDVSDLTDIISSADGIMAWAALCQSMECPEVDCEWAGMLMQDLHSTQVLLRALLHYLGMANTAAMEHLQSISGQSTTTSENLGNAIMAQGVHHFLHNLGSMLLDLASVTSALQDFLTKDPSQIRETEFLEFLENIDGAYEATKDFESAIGTMTNEMLDIGGSDFNLSTPIGDVTADGPSLTGDFNNDKSTLSDIYNIGQDLREIYDAGGDWRNALRNQRAGGGGPFAAVGQIAGRYLKAYSDSIQQEREARIGQLENDLGAEAAAQAGAYEDMQRVQTRRFVAEDAIAAVMAAKTALQACLSKAGCGARSLYNPVLPDFIEIGPNGEQIVGWAWALSRIKIELDVLRPRLKDLPPLRDNCAEDPEDSSYGWFGGDPSETEVLIGQDSPTWCTYTTGGPENTPLIPEDDGDDPRDTPPPDGGGAPEDGDDPRDTPPPSSGGEDDGDDPRDTPRPEDGDDPRDTPGPCDELEQLKQQQIDIGTQLITRGSGLGGSQIDRLTEQFNSNRERIAELEELCPGEDDGDDPRDTPPPDDDDGDDPRDIGGPCSELEVLEGELADLARDILTPGSSRSQAQTQSMVQRAQNIDAEISRLKRICPHGDDPRDAGGPPEDGDDPRDVPTVTIYIKAQQSVLQSDGSNTQTAVPGQMVRIFDPATIDVPLPIPTKSLQNPLVASNTAASVPDRETFATAARNQGSILDELEPTGPGNPFEIGQGGTITIDPTLTTGATDIDVPIGAADEARIQIETRNQRLDDLNGINQPTAGSVINPSGGPSSIAGGLALQGGDGGSFIIQLDDEVGETLGNPLGCTPGNACGDFTYGVTIPADDVPSGFVLRDNPIVIADAFQSLSSNIFSDGFESGNVTSWSNNTGAGGNFIPPTTGLRPQTSAGADPIIGTTDQLGELSLVIPVSALSNWTPGPCDKAGETLLDLKGFVDTNMPDQDASEFTKAADFKGLRKILAGRTPLDGVTDEDRRRIATFEKFNTMLYKLRRYEIDCGTQKDDAQSLGDDLVSTPYQGGGQPDAKTPLFEVNLDATENGSQNLLFTGAHAPSLVNALPQGLQPFVSDTLVIGNNTFVTVTYANAQESQVNQLISQVRDLESVEINYCRDKQQSGPQSPPNDPHFSARGSWGQNHEDQWAIRAVGLDDSRESAWFNLGDNPQPVIVAVIDTGLDWNHLDMAWENLWLNQGEIPDNGIDDDFNGYVDDLIGWNFYEKTNNPWDHDGHGTIVTGIIAANTNNGLGIAGINPYARIMVLKGLNAFGHSRASYLAKAIVYAADNGAQVISMSVGGKEMTMIEQQALDYAYSKGAVIVIAAGNEGVNVDSYGLAANDNVITVGATGLDGKHAIFSNWGSKIDIAAPGVEVLSLRARSTDTMRGIEGVEYVERANYVGEDRRYYRASGTSFAAPIVAGVASLLLTRDPTLTNDEVKQILLQSARDTDTPGVDQFSGYGIVDAQAALRTPAGYFVEASISGVGVDQANALIQVNGNAVADEFDEAWIEIGPGPAPTSWKRIGSNLSDPVEGGIVGNIPFSELGGSPQWTIKLVVRHQDGRSREAWFLLSLG